jgi:F-type H+-transporting ATPase subunit epsilon
MEHAPAAGKQIQCVIVTPERTVVDETVDFVALPMYDGELGVLGGRAPMIGRLGPGELRTRKGNAVHRYFVDGGFAQVRENTVTVLTPRAQRAEEIDPRAVAQVLESRTPSAVPEGRLKAQQRARIQLRIARKAGGEDAPLGHGTH